MKAAFLYNANDLRLEEAEKPSINDDEILVKYEKAKSVTPGQLCALYLEDGCCIGSGIIKEVRKNDEKLWYLL